jgi:2-polyprenyl-3-methyl-5-hydroxy-6-metoxy-1,4-benzoquinol methylase
MLGMSAAHEDSKRLEKTWNEWASADPLFAILSDPKKLGGKWNLEEFMAHTPELDEALAMAKDHGFVFGRERALDFGCGVGRITQALANHFDKVVGIDISDAMIAQAASLNRHGERCTYVSGNLKQLPDATFDFAFSVYVIQHIPRSMQPEVLRDLVRVIKPDGLAMIQIAAPPTGIRRMRTQFGPRWLKELRFRRRFGTAPLIEMNPLSEERVREIVAPGRVGARQGEWYFLQPPVRSEPRRSTPGRS